MSARAELARMKRSLAGWLGAKAKLQAVARGEIPGNAAYADNVLRQPSATEDELGRQLGRLLNEISPATPVPSGAAERAKVLLAIEAQAQQAPGILPLLVIAGAAVLVIGSAIKSKADQAKYEAELEFKRATGEALNPWYQNIGVLAMIAVGGWFVWTKTNVFSKFKKA